MFLWVDLPAMFEDTPNSGRVWIVADKVHMTSRIQHAIPKIPNPRCSFITQMLHVWYI